MQTIKNIETDKWTRPWEIEKFDNLVMKDERFFSILIKGCLGWFNNNIIMYNKPIKHFIFNTGSSYLYVETNGYEFQWSETSGEDYMYMQTPRCIATIGEIAVQMEELTNPFMRGNYERYSQDGTIKGFNAEIRRLPIEITINLQYVLSNFNEEIILIQELFDKIIFQRYFNITYLGQIIQCSIEFPNSTSINPQQVDLGSAEEKHRNIEISIKLSSFYPIINTDTEISSDKVISEFTYKNVNELGTSISDKDKKIIS